MGLDRTTPIGKMIDSYLRSQSEMDDRAIHLLFSANRWELAYVLVSLPLPSYLYIRLRCRKSIEESLAVGTTVLCDRYAFSGIAFSAAKNLPGMSYEWCRGPDVALPAPDLTLFLAVSPEAQRARGGFGAERREGAWGAEEAGAEGGEGGWAEGG